MATGSPKSRHPAPTIHEARLASGPSGAVEWESALTLEQAIARRRQELDIVVRGEDEKVAANASAEWDKVHQAYLKHLDTIRLKLPKSVQVLLNDYCLHDAKVISMGRD